MAWGLNSRSARNCSWVQNSVHASAGREARVLGLVFKWYIAKPHCKFLSITLIGNKENWFISGKAIVWLLAKLPNRPMSEPLCWSVSGASVPRRSVGGHSDCQDCSLPLPANREWDPCKSRKSFRCSYACIGYRSLHKCCAILRCIFSQNVLSWNCYYCAPQSTKQISKSRTQPSAAELLQILESAERALRSRRPFVE